MKKTIITEMKASTMFKLLNFVYDNQGDFTPEEKAQIQEMLDNMILFERKAGGEKSILKPGPARPRKI